MALTFWSIGQQGYHTELSKVSFYLLLVPKHESSYTEHKPYLGLFFGGLACFTLLAQLLVIDLAACDNMFKRFPEFGQVLFNWFGIGEACLNDLIKRLL